MTVAPEEQAANKTSEDPLTPSTDTTQSPPFASAPEEAEPRACSWSATPARTRSLSSDATNKSFAAAEVIERVK